MTRRHAGKVAVVTGSARGIGASIAMKLAEDGAKIALLDVEDAAGRCHADRLRAISEDVIFQHCDVGQKSQVEIAFARVLEHFGTVDILMNNAGINHREELLQLEEEDWDRVIGTNLKSVFLTTQQAGRIMRDHGRGGAIVNMASTSVCMTMPTISAYAASKGGISSFTIASSLSLAPFGIRVNSVAPGTIETEMTRQRLLEDDDQRRRILSRTPLGRIGTGRDVANIVSFLASEEAAYVTGQNVLIDGGRRGLNYTVPVQE